MTVKMPEKAAVQKEVVIPAPETQIPPEFQTQVKSLTDSLVAKLEGFTEDYAKRLTAEIAEPILPGGYQYWNCLTAGPFQIPLANPPYRPSKIIAQSEPWPALTLMLGFIWVNPMNGPGSSLPGTIVLGDRHYRVRFETINLTTVANGPDFTFVDTFGSPAAVVTPIPWVIPVADPGLNPNLYEVNMTVDVTVGGQPFAAFSTWHWDPDYEPPFLGLPPVPPHLQYERPARFMVYHK